MQLYEDGRGQVALRPHAGAQRGRIRPSLGSGAPARASCCLLPAEVCDLILKALLEMGGMFRLQSGQG